MMFHRGMWLNMVKHGQTWLPSGNYRKSPFLMGKSTINNSYVSLPEGIYKYIYKYVYVLML
jgi:hypothetical protein